MTGIMEATGLTPTCGRTTPLGGLDLSVAQGAVHVAEGERIGLIAPSDQPRQRAAILLLLWSLGALPLHEQLERLLGVDLLGDPETFGPYVLPVLEAVRPGGHA